MSLVTTARTLGSLAIVIMVACNSPEQEAYRRIANEANPSLTAMRPAAAKLLALKPEDHTAIVEACMSADEQLWMLRKIDFNGERVSPRRDVSVSWYVISLLDDRSVTCKPDDEDGSRAQRCSRWCLEVWRAMIKAVDRLRRAAKEEGIEIVALRP
jgi:hypothetical protein